MNKFWLCLVLTLLISPICYGAPTHMGVEPQELVSLMRQCFKNDDGEIECRFIRQLADGAKEIPFEIPEGKVLVVTEFEWEYINTEPNELDGTPVRFSLWACSTSQLGCLTILPDAHSFTTAHQVGPIIGGAIYASGSLEMTTGFAISRSRFLKAGLTDAYGGGIATEGEFIKMEVNVRGYLVAIECGVPGGPPCR
jgi:hypothetical protein